MKAKIFFLVCLFFSLGITQLSAQNGKDGTGTISGTDTYAWELPVYCPDADGNLVVTDNLTGTATQHYWQHYLKGVHQRCWGINFGEAASASGEVFKVKEIDKVDTFNGLSYVRVNLIGNRGSHYLGTFVYEFETNVLTPLTANCPGN